MRPLRLGTRGSRLALIQSELVAQRLRQIGVRVELVTIVTEGDVRLKDAPIAEGVFVAALEHQLRTGEIDFAVHSAKDVPLDLDPELPLVAFPERGDPRDALVTRRGEGSLSELQPRARVGTDSPRRTAFVHSVRPDLDVVPLMGNVDLRVERLDAGEADALILAAAGLDRLGLGARIATRLDPKLMPPAPAQGALAIQARRSDSLVFAQLSRIDDRRIRMEVTTERAALKAFGGGYTAPFGALATVCGASRLRLIAGAATSGGTHRHVFTTVITADDVATQAGAAVFMAGELHRRVPLPTRALLETRPGPDPEFAGHAGRLGYRVVHVPTVAIAPVESAANLDRARTELAAYDWVVLTSKRGVAALFEGLSGELPASVKWAAVGPTTSRALRERGVEVAAQPPIAVGDAIPAAMDEVKPLRGARVLLARADAAGQSLPDQLRRSGAQVDDIVAYRSIAAPGESRQPLVHALMDPELAAIVFASGSAVRGLVELAGPLLRYAKGSNVFTIGPRTSDVARELGFCVASEGTSPDPAGLSAALARALEKEVTTWIESQLANST